MLGKKVSQLHVGSSMSKDWGGIERYVVYVSTEMQLRGHKVVVASPQNSPLSKNLSTPQVNARLWHKYDPISFAKFLRIFRATRPQLAITHFSPDYIMPAYAAKLAGVKTCMTRHVTAHFKSRRVKVYDRLYDGFIGISKSVVDHLITDGIPSSKVHLAYNGSPPLVAQSCLNFESPSIGVFGRLVWVKGQDSAIRSLEHLPNVHLHLFGEGPFQGELQLLAGALGLQNRVHFHGHVSQVANAMNSCDVILIPSVWREAFGFTAVEAMSLGKPIVANNYGGLAEIFENNKSALLYSSSDPEKPDPEEIANKIRTLLTNPDLAAELGENAKQKFYESFTVEKMVDQLEMAYAKVVG